MIIEHEPPARYKPLPSAVSETTDKFRVPPLRPTESFDPLKNLVPPSPYTIVHKPFLRYHGQSTYTDSFTKPNFHSGFMLRTTELGSWSDPVGKRGDFYGPSTYERHYLWPTIPEMRRIPILQPTVGWGIIPILGYGGEEEVQEAKRPDEEVPEEKKLGSWEEHCDPRKKAEVVEDQQTTHRHDYTTRCMLGVKRTPYRLSDNLKFTGDMQTISTVMRDFPPQCSNYEDSWCED